MRVESVQDDVAAIEQIDAVSRILEVVCRTTGMGFAAVARVTPDRWIACAVRDQIAFGLTPGGELPVETTICNEIRQTGRLVVVDHVDEDETFCRHPTAKQYGFQSYISVPITLEDGSFFGTLCAIDPRPIKLNTPETVKMFVLFAELIAFHLDARGRVTGLEAAVASRTAALQEQVAVSNADRETLRALTGRLERVREDERTAIARELHDQFGQSLTALKLDLSATAKALSNEPAARINGVMDRITGMDAIVESALDDIERIVSDLRPAVLDTLGCGAAAGWLIAQFTRRTSIHTTFEGDPAIALAQDTGTAVFRILQEALTNIMRHADASSVAVTLALVGDVVMLRITDNGRGLSEADRARPGAFGLRGMSERVRALHGSIAFGAPASGGLHVTVQLPITPADDAA